MKEITPERLRKIGTNSRDLTLPDLYTTNSWEVFSDSRGLIVSMILTSKEIF